MRARCFFRLCIFSFALLLGSQFSQAQAPPGFVPIPARTPWCEFTVVMGRLVARCDRFGQNMSTSSRNEETGVRESYSVALAEAQPSVRYEFESPDMAFECEFTGQGEVTLQRTPRGAAGVSEVSFRQPPRGKLELVVITRERKVYKADTLWHLLLGQGDVCREHLFPLLSMLRSDWNLDLACEQFQEQLFRSPAPRSVATQQRWTALVKRLDAGTFPERQAAERELRGEGLAAVAYLRTLNERTLSGEQRQRVRRIVYDLTADLTDTPDRLTAWLANDRNLWLGLLRHADADRRKLAAERLGQITGEPLAFDAHASPDARQAVIDRLEKFWGGRE